VRLNLGWSIGIAVVVGLVIPVTVAALFVFQQREKEFAGRLASDHERITGILALGHARDRSGRSTSSLPSRSSTRCSTTARRRCPWCATGAWARSCNNRTPNAARDRQLELTRE
jgi:hypothetical protein